MYASLEPIMPLTIMIKPMSITCWAVIPTYLPVLTATRIPRTKPMATKRPYVCMVRGPMEKRSGCIFSLFPYIFTGA